MFGCTFYRKNNYKLVFGVESEINELAPFYILNEIGSFKQRDLGGRLRYYCPFFLYKNQEYKNNNALIVKFRNELSNLKVGEERLKILQCYALILFFPALYTPSMVKCFNLKYSKEFEDKTFQILFCNNAVSSIAFDIMSLEEVKGSEEVKEAIKKRNEIVKAANVLYMCKVCFLYIKLMQEQNKANTGFARFPIIYLASIKKAVTSVLLDEEVDDFFG